ncbi:Gcd10p-domain-containing protein [Amniculicola lignicola CBS 123094]|uniref:tRNA (adenine(58)-N(1))-methyltransferase non-catalytic subunit TRM6 n=1 Tax=Amniculicola lignicola CBS 123094 TaxID=1392246 RepID=A0A6A5WRH4_9PLEO|nr:Gcd10p-domain-containing protein [Amniculicola lignicola CBS 123094]
MHSFVRPNTHIALRLPSGILKVIEVKPNTSINLGKYGTFPACLLFGRPYYLTFEVLDKDDGRSSTELRVVPASELHAEALGEEHVASESRDEPGEGGGAEFDIVGEDGAVIMRSNRLTIDDPSRQKLSMEEIEELKKAGTGSGKDIIAKIMASHQAIDEKTSFSLAKYTLRKARKYLKRFTVLPLDVGTLTEYVTEKEAYKVLEVREESLGLISSWANVHHGGASRYLTAQDEISQIGGGRWLVVDDTGGLIVAAMAEKMGILYPTEEGDEESEEEDAVTESFAEAQLGRSISRDREGSKEVSLNGTAGETTATRDIDTAMPDASSEPTNGTPTTSTPAPNPATPSTTSNGPSKSRKHHQHTSQMTARTNTLTVLHPNSQPNLAFLKYFSFDSGAPAPSHPLYHHLRSLSWLSLISPHEDPAYDEPELLSEEALAGLKSSKRGNYYKKRRRWEKTSMVVDETGRGGFDGLVVASTMEPASVLKHLVPLVRGGGRVVVYSNSVEPLVELCDFYSKERRTAWVARQYETELRKPNGKVKKEMKEDDEDKEEKVNGELDGDDDADFPVNPTLLLAPSLQTARARHWQVLPGRTHPLMTSRGGAEGYLFTGTRVLPVEGKVEARGTFRGKKRKTVTEDAVQT